MSGSRIQSKVSRGIAKAGRRTGTGELFGLLKKPGATLPDPETPPQNPFPDPNAPPPVDPPPAPVAPDPVPVGIMLDTFTKRHHDKWEVRSTDLLVIMEATGPVPTQGDTLEVSGLDYAVLAVDPLAPGGVALMYECQCRR